jgi:ABC-2 type transport system permease protein
MFRNLQIEWMKIKNYRVFQVFSILYLLGILIIIYIFYKIYISFIGQLQKAMTGVSNEASDMLGLFSTNNLPYTVCFWTSLLLYLPGMIIINLFINEVNFKTHRQNIIDGWKRETFILTKISLIACLSAAIMIMNFLAMVIMAQITGAEITIDAVIVSLFSFLQAFVYLMFALFLATLFRRSGIAIIVYFIYGIILEWLLWWLVAKIHPSLPYFLPLQSSDSLIPFSRFRELYQHLPSVGVLLAVVFGYALLFVTLAVRKYKYDDL